MGIVWHGNFVKYMEDGRESFGRSFGLGYYNLYEQGLLVPIVKMDIDYKLQVKYGEHIIIETTWENCAAAKIIFRYRILREADEALLMTARTTQVFLNKQGELELTNPEFYLEWKRRNAVETL
ncbi:MAG: acyl-CoA thioesterase [Bacteroidetes bacterium]|nr:acyl-CoA thioesterase [Bacteroidota bacterium]